MSQLLNKCMLLMNKNNHLYYTRLQRQTQPLATSAVNVTADSVFIFINNCAVFVRDFLLHVYIDCVPAPKSVWVNVYSCFIFASYSYLNLHNASVCLCLTATIQSVFKTHSQTAAILRSRKGIYWALEALINQPWTPWTPWWGCSMKIRTILQEWGKVSVLFRSIYEQH